MNVAADPTALDWLGESPAVTTPSEPGGRGGFLTDLIVELGFCTEREVADAVRIGRDTGKLPTALLVADGKLTGDELARAIAERNGLAYVDLPRFAVDESALLLVERSAAARYRAAPIAFAPDGTLVVALADPLDALAVSDIATITKSQIVPVVADAGEIEKLGSRMPETPPSSLAIFEQLSDPHLAIDQLPAGHGDAAELERLKRDLERERDTVDELAGQLLAAKRRAEAAEQRAEILTRRANALDRRAIDAERRAAEAEQRAGGQNGQRTGS